MRFLKRFLFGDKLNQNQSPESSNQWKSLAEVMTAVINKRAGGVGLISGRKAFMKPLKEGIKILNAIQDVYLEEKITVA